MNGIFIIVASIVSLAVAQQSPVLIIPGTGGNRLEARLDKSEGRWQWKNSNPNLVDCGAMVTAN